MCALSIGMVQPGVQVPGQVTQNHKVNCCSPFSASLCMHLTTSLYKTVMK